MLLCFLFTDMSSEDSRTRVNYTKHELDCLKHIISIHPDINIKEHDKISEQLKREAWKNIREAYNSNTNNRKRSVAQLKGAWKRIRFRLGWKSEQGIIRGTLTPDPLSPTREPEEERPMILNAYSIPDYDYKDCVINEPSQPNIGTLSPTSVHSEQTHITSTSTFRPEFKKNTKRTATWIRDLGLVHRDELHALKTAHQIEEHNMRMKVLAEELQYWREMRASVRSSASLRQTPDLPQSSPSVSQETSIMKTSMTPEYEPKEITKFYS